MRLNTLRPGKGAKKKAQRVGRGIGSGSGKTAGRGHKGQSSRSGGGVMLGFEGGQMPLQRRVPKQGFKSRVGQTTDEIRLNELAAVEGGEITLETLLKADLITRSIKRVKIIASGKLDKAVTVKGIKVTAGAKKAIEAAGGKVED